MPVYIGIVLKILSDFVLILIEYCFPKIIYIHIGQMFLRKFRFVEFSIPRFLPTGKLLHEKEPLRSRIKTISVRSFFMI